jgi:exopolysaccharide biosynthesis predicted pyruvyltransferase EpsI
VRGKLTALNLKTDAVLGDVGLLASRIWTKEPARYNIGVVRHYVDKDDYPFADIIIDATEPPETVIKKISSCRVILSSSLHGLIIADSYGIPNMRIARDDVISGNWKWMDYKTAFVKPLNEIQDDLLEAIAKL